MSVPKELTRDTDRGFAWSVPKELDVPADTLRLRLDFFHQACVMSTYNGESVETKPVDVLEVAHALASELSFSTGLLPLDTLWWQNTRIGPVTAIYEPPKVRKLALQKAFGNKPKRYTIPLPGFIFLCIPGREPWVYAVKTRPTSVKDPVYKAPLANVFANGRSCPGSQRYPLEVDKHIELFFISFFSHDADVKGRSVKFPNNIVALWEFLDKQKPLPDIGATGFPLYDLVSHGFVGDLMQMVKDK